MLTRDYLSNTLVDSVDRITSEEQILEADGMDAILELLMSLRSVSFPAVVLEGRDNGTIQLVEGVLDTYTESIWVMDQLGRGESEAQIYSEAMMLAKKILVKLLDERKNGERILEGWDFGRIIYMKRAGGQNARGWEIVLTFKDDISLLPDADAEQI